MQKTKTDLNGRLWPKRIANVLKTASEKTEKKQEN